MFPRWALRLFRFLLKQKLGKIILGEIDIDNLDIQLLKGTIQLYNLALNVDYLNEKLGTAPVAVKDGCIGCLSVKIPWKVNRCDVEIKDLELVFSPKLVAQNSAAVEGIVPREDTKTSVSSSPLISGDHVIHQDSGFVLFDVHEGVKTIANLVKCLLSNFNVKIRNLIVSFDPHKEEFANTSSPQNMLVFHIMEMDYGTCLSENAGTGSDSGSHNETFLGMTRLMNFVTFRGATVDMLHIVDEVSELQSPSTVGLGLSGSCKAAVPICTGENGSFSGTLKLSMPWKNGSLDTGRVDADFYMDPIELRLQPSTIRFILFLCESMGNIENNFCRNSCGKSVHCDVSSRSALHCQPSSLASHEISSEGVIPASGNLATNTKIHIGCESRLNEFFPGRHLILDWVPLAADMDKADGAALDGDLGASVDQFFECLDKSFHSSLGGSSIWNWTCSVFNTISAASTLATGSLYISTEQQHTETSINASIAGVTLILSFHDDKQNSSGDLRSWEAPYSCDVHPVMELPNPDLRYDLPDQPSCGHGFFHYLKATLQGLNLTFQIFPQEVKFEAVLKQITVDDCFDFTSRTTDTNFWYNVNELLAEVKSVHSLQSGVEGVLPPFPLSFQDPKIFKSLNISNTLNMDFLPGSVSAGVQMGPQNPISMVKRVAMHILQTDDFSEFESALISQHHVDKTKFSISCCIKVPPAILWINLNTVNMLWKLFSEIVGISTSTSNFGAKASKVTSCCSHDEGLASQTCVTISNPTKASVRGSITLSQTRIILCFPIQRPEGSECLYSHNDFITLEFCPMDTMGDASHACSGCSISRGNHSDVSFSSIHLDTGDFNVHLISLLDKDVSKKPSLSAKSIFSSNAGSCDEQSGIFVTWNTGLAVEDDILQRLRDVVNSRNLCRNSSSHKKREFASLSTANDQGCTTTQLRNKLISSSNFTFHVHFSRASLSMGQPEYILLLHLTNQLLDLFSTICSKQDDVDINENHATEKMQSHDVNLSQSLFHLKCDSLEISLLEEVLDVNKSIQKELPGYWSSTRLTVRDFELLCGSNLGRVPGSNLFWVSHGEGELWGSIVCTRGEVSGIHDDFMLLCARNSAMRRGDGDGANVLASGSAGSSIFHLTHPNLFETTTSVTVRCGTLVAPGGRYDWLMAIASFFSLPASESTSSETGRQEKCSQEVCQSSFFLELSDVGLSYEPYWSCFKVGKEDSKSESSDPNKSTGKIEGVACLLAAASLSVSNKSTSVVTSNDYTVGIQDTGLLLCDFPALRTSMDYDVRSLHTNHYVKIAGETLIEVVLRTDSSSGTWELSCSDFHVKLSTCHDTTASLICLVMQLQQLFAPDITESVMHLQTRWNSVMNLNQELSETKINGDSVTSHSMPTAIRNQDNNSSHNGVMDNILDDVFCEETSWSVYPSESSRSHSYVSHSEAIPDKRCFLDATTSSDIFLLNSSSALLHCSEVGNVSDASAYCLPEFIDDYYLLDSVPTQNTSGYHKYNEGGISSNMVASVCVGSGNESSGWYDDGSFRIVENHVPDMQFCSGHTELGSSKSSSSNKFYSIKGELKRKGRIILDNMNATWSMFGGFDWPSSNSNSSHDSKKGGRDLTTCLELSLLGAKIQYDIFPDGELHASELLASIQELHLYDNSKDAPWKMVLGYYHSKQHPRESHAPVVNLSLKSVKPDPCIPLEEYRLGISFLPLRLHLHQSQLDFLIAFFARRQSTCQSCIPKDLCSPTFATSSSELSIVEEALLPFFQKCDISPSVLRIDYIPEHVDLAALGGGNYVELLNLVPWKGIELHLKHVHAAGVYGWSSICEMVLAEWLEDISHNQVHSLVKGLVPLRSLCAVSSGAAKLVTLPIKSYKKDQRLLKGIQRGVIAFLRSISLEAVGLGVHLAGGAHDMLLQTEKILQHGTPSPHGASKIRAHGSVRGNQPNDAQEGVHQAFKTIAHGFGKTASALVGNPLKSYQRGASAGSALASAAKSAPAAAVAPASAAVGAIHCALLGVRNSLDPERMKESVEKYSGSQCLHHNSMG